MIIPTDKSADASFYYHESAAAELARMDSSAVYGNLADAMKNATIAVPNIQVIDTIFVNEQFESEK